MDAVSAAYRKMMWIQRHQHNMYRTGSVIVAAPHRIQDMDTVTAAQQVMNRDGVPAATSIHDMDT